MSGNVIYDSIAYYRGYIEEQIQSGKSQQQVLDELGDAAFIAKSIIDANERKSGRREDVQEESITYGDPYEEMDKKEKREMVEGNIQHILRLIIGIAIFIIILVVVGTIAKIVLPIILVIAAVLFVARLFDKRR